MFPHRFLTSLPLLYLVLLSISLWFASLDNVLCIDTRFGDPNVQNKQSVKFDFAANSEVMLRGGKQQYEVLLERKKSPYGQCWTNAIAKLEKSCHQLNEDVQSWLAVLFTHCFLQSSGFGADMLGSGCEVVLQANEISSRERLRECTKNIDMKAFHSYSLFFVHTQNICFYLRSEQWQKETENLVDTLVQSAQTVSTNLHSAVGQIQQLEELQNSSLNAQLSLNDELTNAKKSLEIFQEQTKEQRDLIEKIIDQFVLLRQFLVIEFSANSAIVFYIFAMLAIYFTTTPQRMLGARLLLYLMLIVTFLLEKNAIDYVLRLELFFAPRLFSSAENFHNFNLQNNVWIIRKFMFALMTAFYIWWMITYKDISQINFKLLNENTLILKNIQKQLHAQSTECFSGKSLNYYSDDDDDDEHNDRCTDTSDSSNSFSDYESDDDSLIGSEMDSDYENQIQGKKRILRKRDSKPSYCGTLPKEFEKETATEFVQNIRSSMKKSLSRERLNCFSSDEN